MTNLLKKNEKGFTLIEVVLVLAIAGLLLVVVFMAVSGAQKSRRDSQRKQDISRVAAQLESYASNNNGNYPTLAQFNATTGTGAFRPYIDTILSPDGAAYGTATATATPTGVNSIGYNITGRTYNVCVALETGVNCRTNQ